MGVEKLNHEYSADDQVQGLSDYELKQAFFDLETQFEILAKPLVIAIVHEYLDRSLMSQQELDDCFEIVTQVLGMSVLSKAEKVTLIDRALKGFHTGRDCPYVSYLLSQLTELNAISVEYPLCRESLLALVRNKKMDAYRVKHLLHANFMDANVIIELEILAVDLLNALAIAQQVLEGDRQDYWLKFISMFLANDKKEFVAFCKKQTDYPEFKVTAWLVDLLIDPSKPSANLAKPKYIRKTWPDIADREYVNLACKLEEFTGRAARIRKAELFNFVNNAKKILNPIYEFILIAAAKSIFKHLEQPVNEKFFNNQYRLLAGEYCGSKELDPLNLDALDKADNSPIKIKDIPTARKWTLSKRLAVSGTQYISLKARNLFADRKKQEHETKKLFHEIIMATGNDFRSLRGGMAKMAQLGLSVEGLLPDNFREEYADELASIYHNCFSVSKATIDAIFVKQFTKTPEQMFAKWEDKPFAIGSIGQVHRAQTFAGKQIVVKVRFPGIEKIVKEDFKSLRSLIWIIQAFLPNQELKKFIKEWEDLSLHECNYFSEVVYQKKAYDIFKDSPDIIVPKIFDEYCSENTIAMEYIEGEHLETFSKQENQARKDRIGQLLFESFMKLFDSGMYRADVHIGNYLVAHNKLAIVDFGAFLTEDQLANFNFFQFKKAVLRNDYDWISNLFMHGGWATKDLAPELTDSFVDTFGEPYRADNFRFTPIYARKVFHFMINNASSQIKMPVGHVHCIRLYWSLYSILGRLNAEGDWRSLMNKYVLNK